jgi:hypothetical protein
MSVILNVILGMVIVKFTMAKVTQVIGISKDVVEVAKRGMDHVDSAKRTINKATTVVKSTREYAELDARRAAAARRPRRDYDVFS